MYYTNKNNTVLKLSDALKGFLFRVYHACRCINVGQALPDNKGFTLIELLVVILIIGILAAIALPQYQKAIYKSRYNSMKFLVNSIVEAQELYYLNHGTYADAFKKLDLLMPAGYEEETPDLYRYPWGSIHLAADHQYAQTNGFLNFGMGYQRRPAHVKYGPNQRYCSVITVDKKDTRSKICAQETKHKTPYVNTTQKYISWTYQ